MLERRQIPQAGETWQHYKVGTKYEIIGVGNHTESEQQMVVYRAPGSSQIWIRPLRMFMSTVGGGVPRFERVAKILNFPSKPAVIIDRDPGDETQVA